MADESSVAAPSEVSPEQEEGQEDVTMDVWFNSEEFIAAETNQKYRMSIT